MQKQTKKWIKGLDLVGHQVTLSYNGNGHVHKTILGGFLSSFVLAFILYITYSKSFTMVTHGDDTISKITELMNEEDLATNISIVDSRMQLFLLGYRNGVPIAEEEYGQYVDVEFV